ncbi:MAG: hypothetical protein LBK26_01305 [Rickettsiales bacterium]|jgi:hypothetical protein|nr:hypothetical protein [Rickettsiales bacterium]
MKKHTLQKSMLYALCSMLFIGAANAVCPVCTVAVGAGLEGARLLGLDDVITGIWAGGFTLVLVFWTAKYMNRKGVHNGLWYLLAFVAYYALVAGVYWLPGIEFGVNSLWGIDKFMLGVIVGTVVLYIAERWNAGIIKRNNGKSRFKMQKVILPMGALLLVSAVFAGILYI